MPARKIVRHGNSGSVKGQEVVVKSKSYTVTLIESLDSLWGQLALLHYWRASARRVQCNLTAWSEACALAALVVASRALSMTATIPRAMSRASWCLSARVTSFMIFSVIAGRELMRSARSSKVRMEESCSRHAKGGAAGSRLQCSMQISTMDQFPLAHRRTRTPFHE